MQDISGAPSVQDILEKRGVNAEEYIIELNGRIINHLELDTVTVGEGDNLSILQIVVGG
jgi:thiamine biosynthesis protein ThiS